MGLTAKRRLLILTNNRCARNQNCIRPNRYRRRPGVRLHDTEGFHITGRAYSTRLAPEHR